MIIEVGKKYQDYDRLGWTIEVVQDLGEFGFVVLYPSGLKAVLSRLLIETLYEPVKETPCDN